MRWIASLVQQMIEARLGRTQITVKYAARVVEDLRKNIQVQQEKTKSSSSRLKVVLSRQCPVRIYQGQMRRDNRPGAEKAHISHTKME